MVALEADVTFSDNGELSSGITHTAGTSIITLVSGGKYSIWFDVTATEPNQFALFKNGIAVSGGIYASGAGTQQNTAW